MNASRLKEIIELLLQRESEHHIQDILGEVNSNLSNLAGAPQEPSHQAGYTDALDRLRNAMEQMVATFEPAQLALFAEIGAYKYFASDIGGDITQSVQENPITPTVSRDYVNKLLDERQTYLDEITQLRDNLEKLGIKVIELAEGTAEIGFLIPRELFDNELEELLNQLKRIHRIIRVFSETATGAAPVIEVRQISTSDPLFFFGLDVRTIDIIARVITWALDTWKRVKEIKKVRADASKLAIFTEDDLTFFNEKIKKTVEAETKKKVNELIKLAHSNTGRTKGEQRNYITSAVETVLALVERGLTVEIRLLLPPAPQEGAEEDQEATVPPEFAQLKEMIPQLVFPPVEGTPVLDLPPPSSPEPEAIAEAAPEVPSRKSVAKKRPRT